jgi:hypothetical protein
LLEILVCKILRQKFIFLLGFLPRPGAGSEHRLRAGIDPGPRIMTAGIAEFERDLTGTVPAPAARQPDAGGFSWRVYKSLPTSMQNWYVGSWTRENPSERLLAPLTSTPHPSIGFQRQRLKCIFCSVAPGHPVSEAWLCAAQSRWRRPLALQRPRLARRASAIRGSGSSPAKSYYKNPRKGIIRVIFRPQTANLGFFGCLLREIIACIMACVCQSAPNCRISRNKPGI